MKIVFSDKMNRSEASPKGSYVCVKANNLYLKKSVMLCNSLSKKTRYLLDYLYSETVSPILFELNSSLSYITN